MLWCAVSAVGGRRFVGKRSPPFPMRAPGRGAGSSGCTAGTNAAEEEVPLLVRSGRRAVRGAEFDVIGSCITAFGALPL